MKKKNKDPKLSRFGAILSWLVFTLAVALLACVLWEIENLNVGIAETIFTLRSPLDGADSGVAKSVIGYALPSVLVLSALYGGVLIWIRKHGRVFPVMRIKAWGHTLKLRSRRLLSLVLAVIPLTALALDLAVMEKEMDLSGYIKTRMSKTTVFEDYYVWPSDVAITAQGKPKNLICIYMESMETTFASYESGGYQENNLIPRLTKLAYDELSFGTTEGGRLGGALNVYGANFTTGALMATTSGVPALFPMEDQNEMSEHASFAPNLQNLGSVLEQKGYTQEFMCGSDAAFGGRKNYFASHGNYKIYDLYTARETGRIPSDYFVRWGFEDKVLYDIAKEQVLEMAESGQPFNFTMLTVDTHFPGGYVCDECDTETFNEETYKYPLAAVVDCADRQVSEFVEWCKQQDFYDDTVIVILGDHPRMDNQLVENLTMDVRRIYNCFINAAGEHVDADFSGREFSQLDMFPTILAAMGFDIEGNRLGLGVNLMSNEPTLIELYGRDWLDTELQKTSVFYEDNFYY